MNLVPADGVGLVVELLRLSHTAKAFLSVDQRSVSGHASRGAMIQLTAAETRRLFNLHTRVIRPEEFPQHW